MDDRERAEHIRGGYNILGTVITGMFSLIAGGLLGGKVVESVIYIPQKNSLDAQIVELEINVTELQNSYSQLQSQYNDLQAQNEEWAKSYTQLETQYNNLLEDKSEGRENGEQQTIQNPGEENPNGSMTGVVWLDQIEPFFTEGIAPSGKESEGYYELWNANTQKDSLGNEHNHGVRIRSFRGDTYALEYVLDRAYSGIKGIFALEFEYRNVQIANTLKIFTIDDQYEKHLLYSTDQPLQGGIIPIDFDVPFESDVDHIRIEITSADGPSDEFFVALVDTYFY